MKARIGRGHKVVADATLRKAFVRGWTPYETYQWTGVRPWAIKKRWKAMGLKLPKPITQQALEIYALKKRLAKIVKELKTSQQYNHQIEDIND